jgi:chloramphenicol O-acetyltransferase type A
MMRTVDRGSWSRQQHFEFFNAFNHPHFNMCANVDLTKLLPYVKEHKHSFSAAIIYLISRAANAIPEFRYRIRGEEIVEHERVSPAPTILLDNELFSFCIIEYCPDFSEFANRVSRQIAAVKQDPSLSDPPDRDDLLLMTAIPWVSFTSFMHPMRMHPTDSFPRFAWGKYFEENGRVKMPLSVQGHHAVMDGLHVGRYYQLLQEDLEQPDEALADGQAMHLPE